MAWSKRLVWMRISKIAIIVCLILLLLFAGFTVYGNEVGNFVVNIDEPTGTLAATIDENPFSEYAELTTRLNMPALSGQRDATYDWIPTNITDGLGSKNDDANKYYLAFSFYLVNTGEGTADYTMSATITENDGNADDVVRLMIVKGDGDKTTGTIYAKQEATDENLKQVQENAGYYQVDFVNDTTICSVDDSLAPLSYIKYTVVMWLEGEDAECTDDIIGDTIKINMDFTQQS